MENELEAYNLLSESDYFWLIAAFCETPIAKYKDIVDCLLSMPKVYAPNYYNLIRSIELLGPNKELIQNIDRDMDKIKPEYRKHFFDTIKSAATKQNWNPELSIKIIKAICHAKPDTHKNIFPLLEVLSVSPLLPNKLNMRIIAKIELHSMGATLENVNLFFKVFEESSDSFFI